MPTDTTTSPKDGALSPQNAYVSLLSRSGHFGDVGPPPLPGLRPLPTAEALRALTDAPKDEIPNSARISVLYDLAREDFPIDSTRRRSTALSRARWSATGISTRTSS